MPTKKKDKKVLKKNIKQKQKQKQTQSQVVNINLGKRTARTKGSNPKGDSRFASKAPVYGNTYYQPVSQAPNSFSLADIAKLIPSYVPQQVSNPIANTVGNIPVPVPSKSEMKKPSVEYEGSFVPLPKRKPVNLKLPERTIPIPSVAEEIKIPKRARRNKKEMDDARQMEREDIASYNLGSSIYNFVKPEGLPSFLLKTK
jgi:hypothetical protein